MCEKDINNNGAVYLFESPKVPKWPSNVIYQMA